MPTVLQRRRIELRTFTPLSMPGLALWLDASRFLGVDGDSIGTWFDAGGRTAGVTQATASKKPLDKVNILNGWPVSRLDGVDDGLGLTASLLTNTDRYALLGVVAARSTSASGHR